MSGSEDVMEDLKRLAGILGCSGFQPRVRPFVGQGAREDLRRLDTDRVAALVTSLKRRGVSVSLIKDASQDAKSEGAGRHQA